MQLAMQRHYSGEAQVIPIVLRPALWSTAPFANLTALPRDGKPVTKWRPRDDAYRNIAEGIAAVVDQRMTARKGRRSGAVPPGESADKESRGATVESFSSFSTATDIVAFEHDDMLLRPGRKTSPQVLHGLVFPKSAEGLDHFIITPQEGMSSETDRRGADELIDYFSTSLALRDDQVFVNLSAYESNSMIPAELSGTSLGRTLLSQDCMLKRLAASLLHPDCSVGKDYWSQVYAESRRTLGTSKWAFRAFQKITMVPERVGIHEIDGDNAGDNFLNVRPAHYGLYIVSSTMGAKCEEDIFAKTHNPYPSSIPEAVQETLDSICLENFRMIVLPKIKEEINEGEHFTDLRRIFGAPGSCCVDQAK